MNRIRLALIVVSTVLSAINIACSHSPAMNGEVAANRKDSSANANGVATTGLPNNDLKPGAAKPSVPSAKLSAKNAHVQAMPEKKIGTGGNDLYLFTKIRGVLSNEASLKESEIVVSVNNGFVVLRGAVADETKKRRAAELVRGIDGVQQLRNELKTK